MPAQDLDIPLHRIPTRPVSGLVMAVPARSAAPLGTHWSAVVETAVPRRCVPRRLPHGERS
ncbi:hypothetical protein JMF97_10195 [Micromonospora fiedleri]|uniref:Uncharacterized protein n=1 Tax=Micromonospora fiedleri TaxID=1157498 RepID=A0ABS1ULK4_9ACTN|nr:hypothetical protein [Micromonospora fiedleri]MBL6276533.1 hypothetical protein [Micromonospora fiedleri]